MLKGKQKKLDKNNNGRIDAEDFKILQGSKKGMRMGGMMGYGAARKSGMGLQDESMKPGKTMKARKGRLAEYEKGFDVDPLVRSGKMSRSTADAMDTGLNAAMGITGAAGAGLVYKALSSAKKAAKKKEMKKKSKKMTASEGSFKKGKMIKARSGKSVDKKDFMKRRLEVGSLKSVVDVMRDVKRGQKNPSSVLKKAKGGMLKARSGKLAESMKKLREKAYEKSGKKMKGVGRYGKDEYMIQKKLPGMRTGKAVDTLKVIPTVKGKKQIAKDFSPSRINKKTNKYKDYK
jgi:hypothetical protein